MKKIKKKQMFLFSLSFLLLFCCTNFSTVSRNLHQISVISDFIISIGQAVKRQERNFLH